VQTDAAVANAHLLQLESLCGPFDCFVEARKRVSASAHSAPAAAKAPTAAAGKGPKKQEEDISAPSAKRPRASSEHVDPAPAAAAPRKDVRQVAQASAADGDCRAAGGEELTLHVRHAFEIRELSLRKL
jgi:hypothetical protein